MVTIHWQAAGISLSAMSKATGKFIDLPSKALSPHGSEAAWLWMHENGDGKGGHCDHMLVYVPARLVPVVVRLQKRRFEHGRLVIGKRCGASQNTGAKARKEIRS